MSISDGMLLARCGGELSSRRSRLPRGGKLSAELFQRPIEVALERIVELFLGGDPREDSGMTRLEKAVQFLLVRADVRNGNRIEVPVRAREDNRDLLLDRERLILRLLEDLDQTLAAAQL